MVHKKTEYRLQFHLLEKDLRKQIWQDNIKFRESCRTLNREDHYWTYQLTDERCECEDGDVEEDETTLPRHKLKHKLLLSKYGNTKSQDEAKDISKQLEPSSKLNQEEKHTHEAQDMGIQTPDWVPQKLSEKVDSSEEVLAIASEPMEEQGQTKKNVIPVASTHHKELHPHRVHFKNGQSTDRSTHSSSYKMLSPTKTARKAYFEEKKSPFASFGWNDSNRDVGQKKTYNVYAPQDEVYSPALLALKRRREAIEKYLADEAHKKRQESSYKGPVNHSSIWMSEYQEKFSHGKKFVHECSRKRPLSAPPCHRSCGWRYS